MFVHFIEFQNTAVYIRVYDNYRNICQKSIISESLISIFHERKFWTSSEIDKLKQYEALWKVVHPPTWHWIRNVTKAMLQWINNKKTWKLASKSGNNGNSSTATTPFFVGWFVTGFSAWKLTSNISFPVRVHYSDSPKWQLPLCKSELFTFFEIMPKCWLYTFQIHIKL